MKPDFEKALVFASMVRESRAGVHFGMTCPERRALAEAFRTVLGNLKLTPLERQRAEQAAAVPRARIVNQPAKPNRAQRNERKRIWIAVYDVDRAFGGPEEGGWYYDYGAPIPGTHESFFSEERASNRSAELTAATDAINDADKPYSDLSSVMCRGALRVYKSWGGERPAPFPETRPHYE